MSRGSQTEAVAADHDVAEHADVVLEREGAGARATHDVVGELARLTARDGRRARWG